MSSRCGDVRMNLNIRLYSTREAICFILRMILIKHTKILLDKINKNILWQKKYMKFSNEYKINKIKTCLSLLNILTIFLCKLWRISRFPCVEWCSRFDNPIINEKIKTSIKQIILNETNVSNCKCLNTSV